MNARISRFDEGRERREERRRITALSHMQHTMHALTLEIERVKVLGNRDRAVALQGLRERVSHMVQNARTLQRECFALSQAECSTG